LSYIFIGIALLVSVIIVIAAYRSGRSVERSQKKQDPTYLREILDRDQQINDLQNKVNELNKINNRYLSFVFQIPTLVQRLNTTMKFEEIISAITQLVSEIIPTKKVEIYILDGTDNLLKKVSSSERGQKEEVSYTMGEGLVGMAAYHRMLKLKDRADKVQAQRKDTQQPDSQLWMAVPINFRERLLGVIGIGNVKNPTGKENDLMKTVADIAAVALINHAMLEEAKHKANTDPLTGLNNRNYFSHMAQHYAEKSISEGSPVSIFLFDIDNFKHYNDVNGHGEGDKLLKELSELVRSVTRKNSVIVRYGGEEFIVMQLGISKEETFIYADRLREKISVHPFAHKEKQPLGFVSISGGVASFPVDGQSIDKVIQIADSALYRSKSEGRNRVTLHKAHFFSESGAGTREPGMA